MTHSFYWSATCLSSRNDWFSKTNSMQFIIAGNTGRRIKKEVKHKYPQTNLCSSTYMFLERWHVGFNLCQKTNKKTIPIFIKTIIWNTIILPFRFSFRHRLVFTMVIHFFRIIYFCIKRLFICLFVTVILYIINSHLHYIFALPKENV